MTRGPIIAIILAMLWTIFGLSGSEWFWVFLMILPIYTIIIVLNAWRKYNPDNLWSWWIIGIILFFIFFFALMSSLISLWSMIIFLYILALIIAYGATFSPNVPRSFFLFPGIIVGIIVTTIVGEFIELKQVATITSTHSGATASSTWGLK